jgi:hypothetical protein
MVRLDHESRSYTLDICHVHLSLRMVTCLYDYEKELIMQNLGFRFGRCTTLSTNGNYALK